MQFWRCDRKLDTHSKSICMQPMRVMVYAKYSYGIGEKHKTKVRIIYAICIWIPILSIYHDTSYGAKDGKMS